MDAIEESFVPLCIYNNKKGPDAAVLAAYKERSWNNPVVRIVDRDRRDIVARNGSGWTVQAVARQIVAALKKRNRPVPAHVALLLREANAHRKGGVQTAVFGMT